MHALQAKDYLKAPVPLGQQHVDAYQHARRIAWLMTGGWEDPILVDVGVPSLGYSPSWHVLDGNHRLYAAALRKDRLISVSVQGCLTYAAQRFSVKMDRLMEGQEILLAA
ncbi:hypothetical protein [Ralstonia pseudosolanacearum]|uniref:hypothetical protein n=1 Tax=Ralstonia pseudosolanacearum TaxID=1310165 RepID=UPI003CEFE5B8